MIPWRIFLCLYLKLRTKKPLEMNKEEDGAVCFIQTDFF